MAAADYIVFLGILGGGLAIVLLPLFVAWLIARRANLPRKFAFSLLCTVLTYGVTVVVLIAQAPILAAATHLAPTWSALGHQTAANLVGYSAQFLGYATILVPLALLVFVPFWLKKRWAALLSVLGSNNSFKPKPLRSGKGMA